uniref:Uncharacterized protein n=1 Tax=Sphaerodactylus townsendi TaxID=933632 RepID=A0ACB8FS82_9SAUR
MGWGLKSSGSAELPRPTAPAPPALILHLDSRRSGPGIQRAALTCSRSPSSALHGRRHRGAIVRPAWEVSSAWCGGESPSTTLHGPLALPCGGSLGFRDLPPRFFSGAAGTRSRGIMPPSVIFRAAWVFRMAALVPSTCERSPAMKPWSPSRPGPSRMVLRFPGFIPGNPAPSAAEEPRTLRLRPAGDFLCAARKGDKKNHAKKLREDKMAAADFNTAALAPELQEDSKAVAEGKGDQNSAPQTPGEQTLDCLESLGFPENQKKSSLTSSQDLEHLGVLINTTTS